MGDNLGFLQFGTGYFYQKEPDQVDEGQFDRLTMAIASTVRLGSFDTLPMAGTRRGNSERDGLGARQRTRASGRWVPLELRVSRAEVDNAEPNCARIALDAPT